MMNYTLGAKLRFGLVFPAATNDTAFYGGLGFITSHWKFDATYQSATPGSTAQKMPQLLKFKSALHYTAGAQTTITDKMIVAVEANYARFGRIKIDDLRNDTGGFGANTLANFQFKPVLMGVITKIVYKM